jgi:hypothetical protein
VSGKRGVLDLVASEWTQQFSDCSLFWFQLRIACQTGLSELEPSKKKERELKEVNFVVEF